MNSIRAFLTSLVLTASLPLLPGCDSSSGAGSGEPITLLNVSYDPTREFYADFNQEFQKHWLDTTGQQVTVEQSHGGAGKQVRSVMEGLEADVVTLAIAYDLDVMAEKTQMIPTDWQNRLPHNSAPYNTTIVFLVRAGNPKGIKDWDDLAQPGIEVVTPNPKTSGGARLNYLAAWGYALRQPGGNEESAREFLRAIYANTDGLEPGARDSTTKFAHNETGDVLITWENEAFLVQEEFGADKVEIVVPSISILAEPPVTVVDLYASAHGTTEVAQTYLEYLYSPVGQRLAAKHYFRPSEPKHADAADMERFVEVERFSVDEVFGSWSEAQQTHFDDGGVFDEIYAVGN